MSSLLPNPIPHPLRRSLQSLTSRFVTTLLGSVLAVSIAVTWISVDATESFLRSKIEQKFATTLSATSQRIDLWHTERELELDTLSRSSTLEKALQDLPSRGIEGTLDTPATRYLSLVLEQLPQYQALFLLGPEGELLTSAGNAQALDEALRLQLATTTEPRVGELIVTRQGRTHAVSAPVHDRDGKRLGSVHGLLRSNKFDELLASANLGKEGKIFIVAANGEVLAPSDAALMRGRYEHPLPQTPDTPIVNEYEIADGVSVIGGGVPFAHFGWTLIVEEPYAAAFAPVVAIVNQTTAINLGIVLVFSTIALFAARSMLRPIHALSVAARQLADGNLEVEIPTSSRGDELGILTRALGEMMSMLGRNQIDLEKKNEELEAVNDTLAKLSVTDGLTGLYNHRYFQREFEREMKRSVRSGDALSLILIDIDDFKKLNDRYGHAAGDRALCVVADTMRGVMRQSDLLARYGGEEFALLTFRNPLETAMALAEKLRIAVSQVEVPVEDEPDAAPIRLTVSIGVASFEGNERGFFSDADRALYAAKAQGKDCVISATEC